MNGRHQPYHGTDDHPSVSRIIGGERPPASKPPTGYLCPSWPCLQAGHRVPLSTFNAHGRLAAEDHTWRGQRVEGVPV